MCDPPPFLAHPPPFCGLPPLYISTNHLKVSAVSKKLPDCRLVTNNSVFIDLKHGRRARPRRIWYDNLKNASKLHICLHFNEIQGKYIEPPFLDKSLPLSIEIFETPLSVNFGKLDPPFRKGGPS